MSFVFSKIVDTCILTLLVWCVLGDHGEATEVFVVEEAIDVVGEGMRKFVEVATLVVMHSSDCLSLTEEVNWPLLGLELSKGLGNSKIWGLWLALDRGEAGASKCTSMLAILESLLESVEDSPGRNPVSCSCGQLVQSVVVMVITEGEFGTLTLEVSVNTSALRFWLFKCSELQDDNSVGEGSFPPVRAKFSGTELEREKMGDTSVAGVSITKVGKFMSSRWKATISTSAEAGDSKEPSEPRSILSLLFSDWGADMLLWDLHRCFLLDQWNSLDLLAWLPEFFSCLFSLKDSGLLIALPLLDSHTWFIWPLELDWAGLAKLWPIAFRASWVGLFLDWTPLCFA